MLTKTFQLFDIKFKKNKKTKILADGNDPILAKWTDIHLAAFARHTKNARCKRISGKSHKLKTRINTDIFTISVIF